MQAKEHILIQVRIQKRPDTHDDAGEVDGATALFQLQRPLS